MTEMVLWLVGGYAACFLLGMFVSQLSEAWYLELKAEPKYRTAMCVRGKFYYVVPESEYVHLVPRISL